MSQRLTLGSLRSEFSRVSQVLGVCPDDDRIGAWASNFQERAWAQGRWWGTTQLMTFCLTGESCIVLPREVAVIEQATLNGAPMRMGNLWYQFNKPHEWITGSSANCSSNGRCNCCGCGPMTMEDRGTAASFATTTGTDKKIRLYPGNAVDEGKTVIIQGYDANGVWVRSTVDGVRIDGEQVTLALPYAETTTTWGPDPNTRKGAPVAVIKESTQYRVLMYSVDGDGVEVQLANYEPSETHPMYRVVSIPGLSNCTASASGCTTKTLKAIVSLQHVPITADEDWLLFTNLAAYKQGVMAEKYYEEGNIALGDAYFYGQPRPARNGRGVLRHTLGQGAISLLEAELRKMTGDITTVNMGRDVLNLGGFQ